MQTTAPRLTWIQAAPKPVDLYDAECGMYAFEISRSSDQGYALQMWRTRPEDWPLLFFAVDDYALEEAKVWKLPA